MTEKQFQVIHYGCIGNKPSGLWTANWHLIGKKKNLAERGNATRRLLLKLLENFFSWQNSQGTQMRRILLWSKTPQSVRAPKACRRLEYCLHLALNLTSTHFKILNTLHSFSCKSFFLSYSSWFSKVKTVIQNQVFWLRWLKLFG